MAITHHAGLMATAVQTVLGLLDRLGWRLGNSVLGVEPITSADMGTSTSDRDVVPSTSTLIPVSKSASPYDSEAQLVRDFVHAIRADQAPIRAAIVGAEFDYRDGRTDVISLSHDGELCAFEAKLTQWRVALHQASRATSFANRSYVVLPASVANRALAFSSEFDQRRVGLCAMRADGTLEILHAAPRVDPLMPWVSQRAVAYLNNVQN